MFILCVVTAENPDPPPWLAPYDFFKILFGGVETVCVWLAILFVFSRKHVLTENMKKE